MPARSSNSLNVLLENLNQAGNGNGTFDPALAENVRLTLSAYSFSPDLVLQLVHLGLLVIQTSPTQDGFKPLIDIIIHALKSVSFDDLAPIPIEKVIEGLQSPSEVVQELGLAYLEKAGESPSGAATISRHEILVQSLIKLYLNSPSGEGRAERILETLLLLMGVDYPGTKTQLPDGDATGSATGQGLLWRRIFEDKNVYQLFFTCTTNTIDGVQTPLVAASTAQARLQDLILYMVDLRWDMCVDETMHEKTTGQLRGRMDCGKSLLDYATTVMTDRSDPLILVDGFFFISSLVKVTQLGGFAPRSSYPTNSSLALEHLLSTGVHRQMVEYYLVPEKYDAELKDIGLFRTHYLRTYLSYYPEHFVESGSQKDAVMAKLSREFSGPRRSLTEEDQHSVAVMAHIPVNLFVSLSDDQCPVLHLPTNPADARVFSALAKIFHGPSKPHGPEETPIRPNLIPNSGMVAISSRALFFRYVTLNPQFWANIGGAMNVIAMPDEGVAAFELLRAILTAFWVALSDDSGIESGLTRLLGEKPPTSGVATVIKYGSITIDSLVSYFKYTAYVDSETNERVRRLEAAQNKAGKQMLELMEKGAGRDGCDEELWRNTLKRLRDRFTKPRAPGQNGSMVGLMGA